MRHNVLIALALAGCGNLRFDFEGEGTLARPDDADTDLPADTDDAPGDTDVPDDGACPEAWPDRDVTSGACADAPATDWTLVEKDRSSDTSAAADFVVARFYDQDGDGDIDTDDPPSVLAHAADGIGLFGADLDVAVDYDPMYARSILAAGRVDSARQGAQTVLRYYEWYEPLRIAWFDPSSYADILSSDPNYGHMAFSWLTDLEGDGSVELLYANRVVDAADGSPIVTLAGTKATSHVTADLDLDGTEEILGLREDGGDVVFGMWSADGTWQGDCFDSPGLEMLEPVFAVGDLDGDAEGEFVVAGIDVVAVCDSDGTLLSSTDVGTWHPRTLGIGDLDADGEPEIVVSDYDRVVALDADLTLLWEVSFGMGYWRPPFALADLDGDGAHEIVVQALTDVLVLEGAAGSTLASFPNGFTSVMSAPAVVDLDGDGLSEILVGGDAGLVAIANADGGFAAPAPQDTWSHSIGVHPGDRTADGTVPGPSLGVHWASPETNVWQGIPAGVGNSFADLFVDSVEICDVDCSDASTIAVYVGNAGDRALDEDVTVTITAASDGSLVAEETLEGPHEPGVARAVILEARTADLDDELQVTIGHGAAFPECATRANVSIAPGTSCE